ncbi:hypothetical protein HK097_010004 [Rhizophlyctis rosea]|uniref:Uncharacterized protein n=1 Tax=Rhizophlyctis rosea TaxID=64517 RepID=A0AAD5S865_9FUNG|nr:hypothetical protein HK097_010004 [Rhizophlyctis rosea]
MNFGTRDSFEQAYDQAMDLLILDRADEYKARYSVPFLALQLGKDQACYDFLKRYFTVTPTYDPSLPSLNTQNANALESVVYIVESDWKNLDLSVLVAMYLLKLRLMLDGGKTGNKTNTKAVGRPSNTSSNNSRNSHSTDPLSKFQPPSWQAIPNLRSLETRPPRLQHPAQPRPL